MVYLTDRNRFFDIRFLIPGPIFGQTADWLPDFCHPAAFIFLQTALSPCRKTLRGAALFWGGSNLLFEMGQALPETVSSRMPEPLASYFLSGTFAVSDMIAISAGTLAAVLVGASLLPAQPRQEIS